MEFHMVRDLLLTFHLVIAPVRTCLVLSWRSLCTKPAACRSLQGELLPPPKSFFIFWWLPIHFVIPVAPLGTVSLSFLNAGGHNCTQYSQRHLICALFSMEMPFLKYSEIAGPFFLTSHINFTHSEVTDELPHVPLCLISWWALTLQQKLLLVPKFTVLHFVLLIEGGLNLLQPSHHPFQIFLFCVNSISSFCVIGRCPYILFQGYISILYIYNNPGSLTCLWEIPLCFPQYQWFPFRQTHDHFPVNLLLYCTTIFVLISVLCIFCVVPHQKPLWGPGRWDLLYFPIQEVTHFKEKAAQTCHIFSLWTKNTF